MLSQQVRSFRDQNGSMAHANRIILTIAFGVNVLFYNFRIQTKDGKIHINRGGDKHTRGHNGILN